jgi:hypothetical protein
MKLIDKNRVVAEIEKRINFNEKLNAHSRLDECNAILSFLDTLEAEDVDSFDATVCKIGNTYLKEMEKDAIIKALEPYKDGDRVKVIIKAQEGE